MMSLFNERLDVKLAVSLLVILGCVFFVLIFFLDLFQSAQIQQTVADQLAANHAVMNRMIIVVIICFAGVMIAMAGVFHAVIFKPLRILANGLENSIQGGERDLTVRLSLKRKDEIGILADRFDQFISNLDEIIMNIGRKTETVAASASEVSMASEQMNTESRDLSIQSNSVAAAAEEMNSSMHTVAAASEEASTNISMVARSADQMQANIIGVARNCDDAREISNNARSQVDTATEKVGHLGDAAREISKITHVITEIAEQTNLLALNATIEAARAGQAGKGFAVVADEIKHLAAQTTQATEIIREKIEGIQKSTADTVHEVGNISQVISRVDDIVNQITRAIEEQSATATEVAGNIEQASIGISEVNENVAQISLVASEIAKDIAQVDGIASEMSGRADNMTSGARDLDQLSLSLRKMISVFRVSMDREDLAPDSGTADKQIPELMPWRPEFQTHIADVDTQHKELVRLINLLHRAMRLQKGVREVKGILDALADYTVFHFGFEEALFKKFKYNDAETHKSIHKTLVEQVKAFQSDVSRGKATVTMDLMDFLTDWLKTHILKTDMAYVPFLKEKIEKENR